eukprot:scaffold64241_cov19-Tisochrysis_lutea.AAC.4
MDLPTSCPVEKFCWIIRKSAVCPEGWPPDRACSWALPGTSLAVHGTPWQGKLSLEFEKRLKGLAFRKERVRDRDRVTKLYLPKRAGM